MFFVILDTNVITADWHLESMAAKACLDMCKKTGSIIKMPRVVLEELGKQYEDKLLKQRADYNAQARALNRFYPSPAVPILPEIDAGAEAQKYLRSLLRKLGVKRKDVLDYPADALPKLVHKAVHRVKPFTARGEEFRDALLWETVKANLCPDGCATMVFVSQDSAAFVDKNNPANPFHSILLEEVEAQRTINERVRKEYWQGEPCFEFHGTLKAFVNQHYEPVKAVNMEWIKSIVNKNRLKMVLHEFQKYRLDGLTKAALQMVRAVYGKDELNFAITDSWLSMKQYECEFVDFMLYDFSPTNYGVVLGTTGALLLCVHGQSADSDESDIVKFFQVGFRIEFNLDMTRKSGEEFQVDYIEYPSFEPSKAITRKKQKEKNDLV